MQALLTTHVPIKRGANHTTLPSKNRVLWYHFYMILIYTTHSSKEEAQKVTSLLLSEKLIACANYFTMESTYVWKGKEQSEAETVAIYKTANTNWDAVKSLIEKQHPYETPCIIKIEAEANKAFENWINSETR